MVTTLTEIITVSRSIGSGNDNILLVALNTYNLNLTEFRVKSNAVHKENISKKTTGQCWLNTPKLVRATDVHAHDKDEQCSRLAFGAWMKAHQPTMRF